MSDVDFLYYLAGMFMLAMAAMKNQTHMRLCAVGSNVLFIAYGFMAEVMPVLVLNAIIIGMHVYRIAQLRRSESGDRFLHN